MPDPGLWPMIPFPIAHLWSAECVLQAAGSTDAACQHTAHTAYGTACDYIQLLGKQQSIGTLLKDQ